MSQFRASDRDRTGLPSVWKTDMLPFTPRLQLNLILGSFFGKCRNPKQHYRTHPNIATSVSYSDPFPMLIFLPTHGFYISNVATLFALSGIIRFYMSFGDPYIEIGDTMYLNIKF